MKKSLLILTLMLVTSAYVTAQVEPDAGNWKTWFITSGETYRLPPPSAGKEEIGKVIAAQKTADVADILYWNAGAPGYRWYDMAGTLWRSDISGNGALVNMLTSTAIYDATIAAWDTKYTFNRPRPFTASNKVKVHVQKPESPSYPCEHSVAAGAAVTIISHFYPKLADSVNRMAQRAMASRIAAGVAFPSDTRAGFELGKKIAEKEIMLTKDFLTKKQWDGKMPQEPGLWKGNLHCFRSLV